jgi:hypothetical protein
MLTARPRSEQELAYGDEAERNDEHAGPDQDAFVSLFHGESSAQCERDGSRAAPGNRAAGRHTDRAEAQ